MDIGKNWGWIDRGKREECKYGDIYEERLVDEVEIEKEELGVTGHWERCHGQQNGGMGWARMKIEAEMKKGIMREIIYG